MTEEPKKLSLLRERTLELASIFHRKMLENIPDNPEAIAAAEDVTDSEMIESMRHCQYCDKPVWTIEQMRSLLIESDSAENASEILFQILADHMNQCEIGRSMGAPFVKPPESHKGRKVTKTITLLYWIFILVYGFTLFTAGAMILGKLSTFWIVVTAVWVVAAVDRAWERKRNVSKES
jgi:hypothetical protein